MQAVVLGHEKVEPTEQPVPDTATCWTLQHECKSIRSELCKQETWPMVSCVCVDHQHRDTERGWYLAKGQS